MTQGLVIARLLHIPPADSPTITNKTSPHFAEALGADQIDADRQATEPAARVEPYPAHEAQLRHRGELAHRGMFNAMSCAQQDSSSPHPCSAYGVVWPGKNAA